VRTSEGGVVLVTRPEGSAEDLTERLRARGIEAIEAPTIRIESVPPGGPLDRAIRAASGGRFDWVVFTSAAGVEAWFDRARAVGATELQARVGAVGPGTAENLARRGRDPDLVPTTFTTSALGEAFPRGPGSVLLARADLAAPDLEAALRAKGWTVDRVDAYRTAFVEELPPPARAALAEGRVGAITFTSASTVRGFIRAAGRPPDGVAAVCIGPVTAAAAREAGMEVAAEADPHTIEGLADAVVRTGR
jgi:uroporphyrinogen III methyltransferase/synthase